MYVHVVVVFFPEPFGIIVATVVHGVITDTGC
jgi:hypothetical protein